MLGFIICSNSLFIHLTFHASRAHKRFSTQATAAFRIEFPSSGTVRKTFCQHTVRITAKIFHILIVKKKNFHLSLVLQNTSSQLYGCLRSFILFNFISEISTIQKKRWIKILESSCHYLRQKIRKFWSFLKKRRNEITHLQDNPENPSWHKHFPCTQVPWPEQVGSTQSPENRIKGQRHSS